MSISEVYMRRNALLFIILFSGTIISAQEVSDFIHLGFSDDARYLMYGEYGIIGTQSYASIAMVDTVSNRFVGNTPINRSFSAPISTEETGIGALLTLFHEQGALVEEYGINLLAKGRPIYLAVNGESELIFRDFVDNTSYKVSLQQSQKKNDSITESQFFIEGSVQAPGAQNVSFTAGSPQFFRKHVVSYEIRKIIRAPDPHSILIFFVQKNEEINGIPRVRYMVETAVIQ